MTVFSLTPFVVKNSGVVGATLLTEHQLSTLQDGNTTSSGAPIDSPSTVSVIAELQNRYEISEIRYWNSGVGSVTIESSQNADVWDSLTSSYVSGYTLVSGSLDSFQYWPKNIRVTHQVTTGSGEGYELQIKNKGSEQGYWFDGEQEALPVDSSIEAEPSEIPVFNKTSSPKNIYCFIDTQDTSSSYSTLRLATSSGGPYYSVHETGVRFPRDYTFVSGQFSGTTTSGSNIILATYSGTGYYYSPVLDLDVLGPVRLYWEYYDESGTSIDWNDTQTDSQSTAGVRLHHEPPSGGWVSGGSPDTTDSVWGTLSGTLEYAAVPNDSILEISVGQGRYFQTAFKLASTVSGSSPRIQSFGVEEALVLSGVSSYTSLFAKTEVMSYVVGDHSNVITFYYE